MNQSSKHSSVPPPGRFNMRDLVMLMAGATVLIAGLAHLARNGVSKDYIPMVMALYSLPVITGLGGLLLGQLKGGVLGAIGGAFVLMLLLSVLRT